MDTVTTRRIFAEILGMALHLVTLCFGWKFPLRVQRFHAPIVIISYGINMVNSRRDFNIDDQISNIIGI
jgi:hypothetical protein